jgi:hypothetical protein
MLDKLSSGFALFIQALQEAQARRAELYVKHFNGGWE